MKVVFYGTRGSIPVCEPSFQEFGGNTTCVFVIGPDRAGILDAGTGIRQLGKDILRSDDERFVAPMFMLFSHFHWDHIHGFPFFGPAYDSNREFIITAMGADRLKQDLRSIFAGQMEDTYFPVSLDQMGAKFTFLAPDVDQHQLTEDVVPKGTAPRTSDAEHEATVTGNLHGHPGGAYGYRIEGRDHKVLTYCTDIEHGDSLDESVIALARNADLLIHDAQYTREELETHKGWGHSSWEQACEVAERAGVRRLALTHHDPEHDDEFLRDMERRCQDRFTDSFFAREQMELEL